MTPNKFAGILRRIATALDNSKRPSLARVSADLDEAMAALDTPDSPEQTTAAPVSNPSGASADLDKLLSELSENLSEFSQEETDFDKSVNPEAREAIDGIREDAAKLQHTIVKARNALKSSAAPSVAPKM